jgi:oxygen-independent coproporphyrinogen-3 oxidase
MCIYLHIPFCTRKCGFCDSYSFYLASHRDEHMTCYVDLLIDELTQWASQGNLAQRPISTVHMGGGTPTSLDDANFTRLIEAIQHLFNVNAETEWALESTVESLCPDRIRLMHNLGYRRLHIGVQSLQDDVRQMIGRKSLSNTARDRIAETLALGWIVSVDMICGLPGQTQQAFLDDLQILMDAGIDGVSIYELLIYPQNRRWAERHQLLQRDHLPNYRMFVEGALRLEANGYHKNLFNHWANERDENIYFTFPMRGEDLLAVGTIADGVFGEYHYRHPIYAAYRRGVQIDRIGLEGGLLRTPQENAAQPFIQALLSAAIPEPVWRTLTEIPGLTERWQSAELVYPAGEEWLLTPKGAWFTGNMVTEVRSLDFAALPEWMDVERNWNG